MIPYVYLQNLNVDNKLINLLPLKSIESLNLSSIR